MCPEPFHEPPRGVLDVYGTQSGFDWQRFLPSPALAYWVELYWYVGWDLRGREPVVRETLPHPSVGLLFDQTAYIGGVMTGKFSRALQGLDWVFGVKFRPGGFKPFCDRAIQKLTDRTFPIENFFHEPGIQLASAIFAEPDCHRKAELVEAFLLNIRPALQDPNIEKVAGVVRAIQDHADWFRVDQILDAFGLTKRSLHRLFETYVGVTPKWCIQRFRLHEAIAQMESGAPMDLAQLALDLGFYDQAHFSKAFKAVIGVSPGAYPHRQKP